MSVALPLRPRWVVINSSGGKDSQTALRVTVEAAAMAGLPKDRLVVAHADLGEMEWPGSRELAAEQARLHGLRFEVASYRTRRGENLSLLDYVRRRGKWPSSTTRFCTSEYKRGPGGRIVSLLFHEDPGPILNVFGFRAEESPARAKRSVYSKNMRFSTKSREVWDWLPIHDWTEKQVWDDIRASGIPHHPVYDQGMPRLSCSFCIFAPRDALMLAGQLRPDMLDRYCEVEKEIGHTFQNGRSLQSIRDALNAGEKPKAIGGAWNM